MKIRNYCFLISLVAFFGQCKEENQNTSDTLFELKDNHKLGINFSNDLTYNQQFNLYKYRNYYNGGGVGIGDFNNDNLADIYMINNQRSNRLYLNMGNWQFEDITEKSGAGGNKAWSTGVSIVDINADGFLDIYVCNSGDVKGDNKENELFINNGNLTFTEKAAEYGLNDKGYSTHASFFDYDKDGDLDCYILNNSFRAIGSFDLRKNQRNEYEDLGGDKLMRNDNGKFVNVSKQAGIYGSEIGFGLGINTADVNNDGWEDIFISNDFFEKDYLYINQQNGTFKEESDNQMQALSAASMGADIADINNDGWNDIFVTDMLPNDYKRLKTVTTFDDWNRYQQGVLNGYHHQFTRNVLHLNNGNNTFSEVGRLAGVEASDWSWGALFFDMENDGYKDLFIANGIYKDITNQDYLQYIANDSVMTSIINDKGVDYKKLIDIIPSNPVPNHAYKNNGNLSFTNDMNYGLQTKGFSNGSAYGDLDNDGDLDLIVNNVNMPCFVYENKSQQKTTNQYLTLKLKGENKNIDAIGAKVIIEYKDQKIFYEHQPIRGFQSTMDNRIHIGLGSAKEININVEWPYGKKTILNNVKSNQLLILDEKSANDISNKNYKKSNFLLKQSDVIHYTHTESSYNDFNRENLNYHMLSTRGPVAAVGDINGDNKDDIIIPGGRGQITKIYLNKNDVFQEQKDQQSFNMVKEAEHIKADLFDADNDGDLDLYLASGSVEITEYSDLLYDHLFFNDGKGIFTLSTQKLPADKLNISTGTICHSDIDKDGDMDLFVGERVKIGKYGHPGSGYILLNDGKGNFKNESHKICPELNNIGMITDAKFNDFDQDGYDDLIVVGEFMDITIFKNNKNTFSKIKNKFDAFGMWNVIHTADVDNDSDLDIILGNHGLNSRFKANKEYMVQMYFDDFDQNGSPEAIWTKKHEDGNYYPYALRHNLVNRLPMLKKKYRDFESFKNATIENIFTNEKINKSQKFILNELKTTLLINDGNMNFSMKQLPLTAQYSCTYAINTLDIDNDNDQDIIMGGNLYNVQPEVGRYDASYGHIFINDGKGHFSDLSMDKRISIKGEIRDIKIINENVIVFRNNSQVLSFKKEN